MPFRRVPSRVKEFKEWANKEVNNATLSESATPSRTSSRGKGLQQKSMRRRRRSRRKRRRTQE